MRWINKVIATNRNIRKRKQTAAFPVVVCLLTTVNPTKRPLRTNRDVPRGQDHGVRRAEAHVLRNGRAVEQQRGISQLYKELYLRRVLQQDHGRIVLQ